MELLRSPAEMHRWRAGVRGMVGFVPTMGYLHEGHLSLVRLSRQRDDVTVASIFVNPTQFGPNEDFERYPRDEARDLALLEAEGVHAVYLPSVAAMYPPGYQTYVTVEELSKRLEGAARPGHFRGVATVVTKLFGAVQPHRAYFGKKDAQQLRLIRRMVRDLDLPVEIVAGETVREPDGLAMSSRNVYLAPDERAIAPLLYRGLCAARDAFIAGERDAERLRAIVREVVGQEPRIALEYVSVADDETLEEIDGRVERPALLSLAARIGSTRLIDNVELAP
ncbi:MAG: pantoate--beta-alanine ligase [Chloroflexota bacterium]|nr:pantoate--beta-alanine ligase [Chloroflexota bacterium]